MKSRTLKQSINPSTIWLTGLSGAGKSTLAKFMQQRLQQERWACHLLDGDELRRSLNRDLGFSDEDRRENIRRTAEVARLLNDAGLIVICALISPRWADREMARHIVGASRFLEVHVSTPLAVCESRDPKGHYQRAKEGTLTHFTGISAPYEVPLQPVLSLDTSVLGLSEAVEQLWALLPR